MACGRERGREVTVIASMPKRQDGRNTVTCQKERKWMITASIYLSAASWYLKVENEKSVRPCIVRYGLELW